jgi:hypothetical protein
MCTPRKRPRSCSTASAARSRCSAWRDRPERVLAWLETIEQPFQAVYEAGPTGYGLSRRAAEQGFDVQVCSPGHIARRAGDRIKTDRRDAERLARLLLANEPTLVRVPEPAEEQLRDLVRAREDLRVDLMRCRDRVNKFLLRRELYYPKPGGAWTGPHRDWLASLRFDDAASELTFEDMLHANDSMLARRERLERALGELAEASPWAATIARLLKHSASRTSSAGASPSHRTTPRPSSSRPTPTSATTNGTSRSASSSTAKQPPSTQPTTDTPSKQPPAPRGTRPPTGSTPATSDSSRRSPNSCSRMRVRGAKAASTAPRHRSGGAP